MSYTSAWSRTLPYSQISKLRCLAYPGGHKCPFGFRVWDKYYYPPFWLTLCGPSWRNFPLLMMRQPRRPRPYWRWLWNIMLRRSPRWCSWQRAKENRECSQKSTFQLCYLFFYIPISCYCSLSHFNQMRLLWNVSNRENCRHCYNKYSFTNHEKLEHFAMFTLLAFNRELY